MISGESELHWSRPALMYLYMREFTLKEATPYPMSWFQQKGIELKHDWVSAIQRDQKYVHLASGDTLSYDRLLLALGSEPKPLQLSSDHCPDLPHPRIFGMYGLNDLERLQKLTPHLKRVTIVGSGLIGVELAEMMLHEGVTVDLISRSPAFSSHLLAPEEAQLITDRLRKAGVRLWLEEEINEIIDLTSQEETQRSKGQLRVSLKGGAQLESDLLLIAIGVTPAISKLKGIEDLCDRGLQIDECMKTRDPHLFAAGDCAERRHPLPPSSWRSISGSWYEAQMMGREAAYHIFKSLGGSRANEASTKPVFAPSPWYQSSSFLGIEYHEYGTCFSMDHSIPQDTSSLFWSSSDRICTLRVWHHNERVIGICCLGLRLYQPVCARWIKEFHGLKEVVSTLLDARFEPEFDHDLTHARDFLQDLIS